MSAALGRELDQQEHVRHLDGNASNNAAVNLAVGTALDNSKDKITHNTNGHVLRNADVYEIRHLIRRLGARALAARHGVTIGHVQAIATGRRWGGLKA